MTRLLAVASLVAATWSCQVSTASHSPGNATPSASAVAEVTPTPAPVPHPRAAASMAYDAARQQLVLFGGNATENHQWVRLPETWTRQRDAWTRHDVAGPSPRYGAAMVYDPAHSLVLLFGGTGDASSASFADTWTWDGIAWSELHPANSPKPRFNAGLVYDSRRRALLLFGGSDIGVAGELHPFNDTWRWDGSNWIQLHPANAPTPRNYTGLAFDDAAGAAVLYGGRSVGGARYTETWAWDGTDWKWLAYGPFAGFAALAYDPATKQVFAHVMDPGVTPLTQHFMTWDGRAWHAVDPNPAPAVRMFPTLVYDPALQKVVVFSGLQPGAGDVYATDLWWDGSTLRPAG